jgi:hypothetical protein
MERVIEPELLDALPPADRRAKHSRADLRRLNFLIGHAAIMARLWQRLDVPTHPCSLVELGAGDGTFCLKLARRLVPRWPFKAIILVDRHKVVNQDTLADYRELRCPVEVVCQDVFDWLRSGPRFTVLMANLFLHHFRDPELKHLLALASERTEYFIACEPRRDVLSLACSRLLGLVGCNDVTRHDAVVSVRAGFAGREISALWPARDWHVEERGAGLFSHGFAARSMARP